MVNNIKSLGIGLLTGVLIGLWLGVNIGKDQPVFSNPFSNPSLQQKFLDKSGDFLEKSGQAIKNKVPQP